MAVICLGPARTTARFAVSLVTSSTGAARPRESHIRRSRAKTRSSVVSAKPSPIVPKSTRSVVNRPSVQVAMISPSPLPRAKTTALPEAFIAAMSLGNAPASATTVVAPLVTSNRTSCSYRNAPGTSNNACLSPPATGIRTSPARVASGAGRHSAAGDTTRPRFARATSWLPTTTASRNDASTWATGCHRIVVASKIVMAPGPPDADVQNPTMIRPSEVALAARSLSPASLGSGLAVEPDWPNGATTGLPPRELRVKTRGMQPCAVAAAGLVAEAPGGVQATPSVRTRVRPSPHKPRHEAVRSRKPFMQEGPCSTLDLKDGRSP